MCTAGSCQESAVHIIPVFGWPLEKVKENGGRRAYLQHEKGREQGKQTISIFDEAQLSYEDFDLWGKIFIAFAIYGSPTTSSLGIQSILFFVSDSQRVMLRPIDYSDGLDPVGLLFS